MVVRKWPRRKTVVPGQIRREILPSVLSVTTFMLPIALVAIAARTGGTRIYHQIADLGWAWYFFSFVLRFAWQETYFYWSHRVMHWPPIYRRVHAWHHLSRHPTPFTAFAFHPFEALIEGMTFVILAFLVPLHVTAIAIFAPHSSRIGQWINSPRSHGLHHEKFRGNYSFYTNFWDRVMGTRIFEAGEERPAIERSKRASSPEPYDRQSIRFARITLR